MILCWRWMKLATLKKTWLMRMNQTGGNMQQKKKKNFLQPSLSKTGSIRKRGPSSSFFPFYKCQVFQAPSCLPILCTQHGDLGGIWWEGKFQSGRICNRSFPRKPVAEFQIRTSHSRTCTENRRRQEIGNDRPMMLGTIKSDEQNRYLFSSNVTQY